jgi:hypothetical protein
MAVVCVPTIYFCCLERKGLSLEEINGLFGDKVAVQLTHLTEAERAALDETIQGTEVHLKGDPELLSKKRGLNSSGDIVSMVQDIGVLRKSKGVWVRVRYRNARLREVFDRKSFFFHNQFLGLILIA